MNPTGSAVARLRSPFCIPAQQKEACPQTDLLSIAFDQKQMTFGASVKEQMVAVAFFSQ